MLEFLEEGFQFIVQFGVLFLECVGVTVLLVAAVRSIIGCVKKDPHVRLSSPRALLWPWNSSWAERSCAPLSSGSHRSSSPWAPSFSCGRPDLPHPLGDQNEESRISV